MVGDVLVGGVTGALAGAIFFGGLHWPVGHLVQRRSPVIWAVGSLAIRTAIVLALFLLMLDGSPVRGLAGLGGLVLARTAIVSMVRRGGPRRESSWT